MTLTACPVGLVDHDSNPSKTMTLTTCPVGVTWVGVLRTPTQVAPTGQAVRVMVRHVRVMVRHVRVMVRHVYIVPSESSHVEYP